jgi:hypothetical protein
MEVIDRNAVKNDAFTGLVPFDERGQIHLMQSFHQNLSQLNQVAL